jgi:dTDP-glucose 4,6-dehydratase
MVAEKAPIGTIYNAGPPKPTSIRALVETVAKVMEIPFEQLCQVTEDRLGQDSRYWLDSSAITRDLGWEPTISLEEGIKEMVEWGKRYLDQLRDWPMDYTLRA